MLHGWVTSFEFRVRTELAVRAITVPEWPTAK